jgi:hypothetical protein
MYVDTDLRLLVYSIQRYYLNLIQGLVLSRRHVIAACGDQITFGRGLLVGWDLVLDAFGLIVLHRTVSLMFRYFMGVE